MKHLTFFLLLLSISFYSASQQFEWATTGGDLVPSLNASGADDVAVDPFGNVYTIHGSTITQQCQGVVAAPAGAGKNAFLHKFNALGELSYIKVIGGDVTPLNLEVDETGDVYVLFRTATTSIIYNGATIPVTASRNYIMKVDLSGDMVWLHNTGFVVTVNVGMFQYSNGALYYQSDNRTVSKIDTDGNVLNSLSPSFYSTFISSVIRFRGSDVFPNGDLLFAAVSFGDVSYGADTLIGENVTFENAPYMYLRTDQDFNVIYATYVQGLRDAQEGKIPVCIDAQGDLFSALQVSTTTQVGPDIIVGDFNNFSNVIAKIDAAGNGVWARVSSNPIDTKMWAITKTTDNTGVLVAGSYNSNVQFGPHSMSVFSSTSYIVKIDTNGDFIYATPLIGGVSTRPKAITNNGNGNYFIGGKLSDGGIPVFSCIPKPENEGFFVAQFSDVPGTALNCSVTIPGCTDPAACNFSAVATIDNGSCTFPRYFIPTTLNGGPIILACNNPGGDYELAGNQNCIALIAVNDPFCINTNWDQLCFDAYADCAVGCTDNTACNFNPGALTDDGSCSFPGCNNPAACNFDPAVLCNDGSCYVPPVPSLALISPAQIACDGADDLTITGGDFCGLLDVLINGQSCVINSNSDISINCETVQGSGTVTLEVVTIHGSSTTTISYLSPVISSLDASSPTCDGGGTLQITGTNLCDVSEVLFGELSVPVILSTATTIDVIVPPGFGTLEVSVVSPSGVSNSVPLSYQLPFLNSISVVVFSCAGGESVVVGGLSLCDPVSVLINGEEQSIISSSSTSIEFITPPAIGCGIARLKVVSNGFTSNQLIFNYVGDGCTDPLAYNFDPTAVCDSGHCVIVPDTNDCPPDINNDGQVNTGDLNLLLGSFGSSCP